MMLVIVALAQRWRSLVEARMPIAFRAAGGVIAIAGVAFLGVALAA
jgi:drug/metabolite transporter superfamily protein YnfA